MSDGTQGEGWWQASDGKWYPPEQHPEYQAGATQPIPATPPTAPIPAPPPGPPPGAPLAAPLGAPAGPPPGGPPPGAPGGPANNNAKWIIGGVVAVAIVAILAFLLLGGDSKKTNVSASGSSSSSKSTSSSSSSRSTSSSSRSTSSSSTSSSSLTTADVQARMLTASDIAPGFVDGTFTPDTGPTNCGGPNRNQQVPPKGDIGSQSSNGTLSFQEEAIAYNTATDAQKVLDLFKAQTDTTTCPSPTITGGEPVSFTSPSDVTSQLTTPVEAAFEIDFQTTEAQGQFFVIKDGKAIVTFTFVGPQGADTSGVPAPIDLVNKGLDKIVNG
jgi:hypothetical protein